MHAYYHPYSYSRNSYPLQIRANHVRHTSVQLVFETPTSYSLALTFAVWRKGCPGRASKHTWDTTRKHLMRSVLPLRGHWIWRREEKRHHNGSQSSPMRKRPSDEWHQTSRALDSSTPSRHGSISPHCEGRGRVSSSRSSGARPTRVWLATKGPTNGQRLRRRARHPRGGMAEFL